MLFAAVVAYQGLLKDTRLCSYTLNNVLMNVLGWWLLPGEVIEYLAPVWMANTFALHLTFYAMGTLVDRDFFRKMRERYGWSMATFLAGDLALHVVPSVAYAVDAWRRPGVWERRMAANPLFGIQSLFMNLLWAGVVGDFRADCFDRGMSNMYVPENRDAWGLVWHLNALAHLMVSAGLQVLLRR